jgi:molybdopterin-guanine dinucleotide biosynthesis protein A
MGSPKQLLEIGSSTMVEYIVDVLAGCVDEVVLLGDGPVPARLGDLARVADSPNGRGPMAGILGALAARPGACWVVAACDMPQLRPAAVRWLLRERNPDAWAVLPSIDGFVEPLLALYESESRSLLESAAAAGDCALHRLAVHENVIVAEPPDGLRGCWYNANTPQEIDSLRTG